MANPLMNDRSWNQAAKDPGWGAPDPVTRAAPIDDGPISPWNLNRMTVAGTMTAAGVLMILLIMAGAFGWAMGPDNSANATGFPGLAIIGVLVVMLLLYTTKILKVTDRFRRIVITATLGLMLFYLASFVIRLFAGSGSVSFLNSASTFGILFSVFAAGLAAMNLALDFDFIERGSKQGLPKGMEWFAALALTVTLVWLYLEMLRLLSKLQRR
jgi:uncharacterized YccA/Bax inhibitor family protein